MFDQSYLDANKRLELFANEVIDLAKKHNVEMLMFLSHSFENTESNEQQAAQNAYAVGPPHVAIMLLNNLYTKVMDNLSLSILKSSGASAFMQPASTDKEELIN